MKKIVTIAASLLLAGCAGGTASTQIVTQSLELEGSEQYRMEKASVETPVVKPKPKKVMAKPVKKVAKAEPKKTVIAKKAAPKKSASGNKYTIQVIALSHNKGFTTYMNKLPSDKPVWANKKMVDGLPWYTMLYGEFNSKTEAKAALNALPGDVKQYGPFIRTFASIKKSPNPVLKKLN